MGDGAKRGRASNGKGGAVASEIGVAVKDSGAEIRLCSGEGLGDSPTSNEGEGAMIDRIAWFF